MDQPLTDRVWHPDETADYGPGHRESARSFLDFVWGYHRTLDAHSHMVTNIVISVDPSAGTATSEAYVSVWLRSAPSNGAVTDLHHRGLYLDRWSRRDGRWAIDHRIYVADLMHDTSNPPGRETWGRRTPKTRATGSSVVDRVTVLVRKTPQKARGSPKIGSSGSRGVWSCTVSRPRRPYPVRPGRRRPSTNRRGHPHRDRCVPSSAPWCYPRHRGLE